MYDCSLCARGKDRLSHHIEITDSLRADFFRWIIKKYSCNNTQMAQLDEKFIHGMQWPMRSLWQSKLGAVARAQFAFRTNTLRRYSMKTFSSLMSICVGIPPVIGGFCHKETVTQSFDIYMYAWTNGLTECPLFATPGRTCDVIIIYSETCL